MQKILASNRTTEWRSGQDGILLISADMTHGFHSALSAAIDLKEIVMDMAQSSICSTSAASDRLHEDVSYQGSPA